MLGLGAPELVIIAVVLLVLFGSSRLPRFARSLGEARRELQALEEPSTKRTAGPIES